MKKRYRFRSGISVIVFILSFTAFTVKGQNFSGIQNKKLVRLDDIGSLLESGLGGLLGGKVTGKVDSVIVTYDAEKTLKAKIFYTGFENAYFTVSTLSASKQKQGDVVVAKFSQSTQPSPAEVTLLLGDKVVKGTTLESPFFRIDIGKKENGSSNVNVYSLNKNWRNQLDPQNVVINVALQPIGKAASLSKTQAVDIVPAKTIIFDPKLIYYQQPVKPIRTRPDVIIRRGGGNYFKPYLDYTDDNLFDDISGTWVNTDANTSGITKLVITGNNSIQGYGKCAPQDCDWGKVALADQGGNRFKAVFDWSFQSTTLTINYAANLLTVTSLTVRKPGGAASSYTYTFKKNITMIASVANIYTLRQAAAIKVNTGGQPVSKTPLGPGKTQINILDDLAADVEFKYPQDISNIKIYVFPDKNENSGVYYFVPANYHLKWTPKTLPESGYEFKILYGTQKGDATDTGGDAPIRMSATLTTDISIREMNFVRSLLKESLPDFTELRFLPLKESPQFTFQNTLGAQYNIPQSKITVESTSDLSSDIHVAWQTDADTKEFIQAALAERDGIAASIIVKPDADDIIPQQIPTMINFADIHTLGKMTIEPNVWRTRNWQNTTPYPLKLRYLHVLKKQIGGKLPIIYSWSMNDAIVPSQAQVAFDNTKVPAWLDNDPSAVMWIDYSIEDCTECDQKIMDQLTGGVSGAKTQQIKFTIAPAVFDSLKASYFTVTVRSIQTDPKGVQMNELPALKITKDAVKEFTTGPLFVPTGGAVDFEYKITVASTDGDFYSSNDWIRGTDKEILLGKTKMKEIFKGIIPGIN